MKRYEARAEIIHFDKLSETVFHLKIASPEIAKSCCPGQFVMIKVGNQYNPLLRRPFSILNTTTGDGTFEIVFKVVGKGTKLLSEKKGGDFLNILGPLGNSFNIKDSGENYAFIGGGIGFPPLFFMANIMQNKNIIFYYGSKNKNEIFFEKVIQKLCAKLILTTAIIIFS